MNHEEIKKYILDNYGLDFFYSTYGYNECLCYIDKKRKRKYYINLMNNEFDNNKVYIGHDVEAIPYTWGFSGASLFDNVDYISVLDNILQKLFKYEKIKNKQITIFDLEV